MPLVSQITGQPFYASGGTENPVDAVRSICRSLNIGEGKLSKITESMLVNYFERCDREIDEALSDLYYTPIKPYNLTRPDGVTVSVFPGNVARVALFRSASFLLAAEFQGNEPNLQEAATQYYEQSQKALFRMVRFNERIFGQEMKSRGRTMPPTHQIPLLPEQDF